MELDLNAAVEDFPKWELAIRINGTPYQTHPMTFGQMLRLAAMEDGDVRAMREALGKMFIDPAAPVEAISVDQLPVLIGVIQSYASQRAKKNAPAVAEAVRKALET